MPTSALLRQVLNFLRLNTSCSISCARSHSRSHSLSLSLTLSHALSLALCVCRYCKRAAQGSQDTTSGRATDAGRARPELRALISSSSAVNKHDDHAVWYRVSTASGYRAILACSVSARLSVLETQHVGFQGCHLPCPFAARLSVVAHAAARRTEHAASSVRGRAIRPALRRRASSSTTAVPPVAPLHGRLCLAVISIAFV
jgi:hypothetical protein